MLIAGLLACLLLPAAIASVHGAPWAKSSSEGANVVGTSAHKDAPTFQTVADFINRSAGERGEALILKGRNSLIFEGKGNGSSPNKPRQRALGKVFSPEPPSVDFGFDDGFGISIGPFGFADAPLPIIPIGELPTGGSGGNRPTQFPGSIAFVPSGPGGGGGGGGPEPEQPLVNAVPEPQIWFMLIIGFFGCAYVLRRGPMQQVSRLARS